MNRFVPAVRVTSIPSLAPSVVTFVVCSVAVLAGGVGTANAAGEGSVMYRCPGNAYNNTLSAQQAKDKGCKSIEGAPITVIQANRPHPVPSTSSPSQNLNPIGSRIDPVDQRARDSDARRILESELGRDEARLSELRTAYAGGQPERQGNEKNYQKYLDRVAEMKSAIERKESDVASIKRELAKTAP